MSLLLQHFKLSTYISWNACIHKSIALIFCSGRRWQWWRRKLLAPPSSWFLSTKHLSLLCTLRINTNRLLLTINQRQWWWDVFPELVVRQMQNCLSAEPHMLLSGISQIPIVIITIVLIMVPCWAGWLVGWLYVACHPIRGHNSPRLAMNRQITVAQCSQWFCRNSL